MLHEDYEKHLIASDVKYHLDILKNFSVCGN